MTRDEFEGRFQAALVESAALTSSQLGRTVVVPERMVVLVPELSGREVTFAEASEALYLGPERSRVFIDVGIYIGGEHVGAGWICPSGHRPRPPAEVWDPDGVGPFKVIGGFGRKSDWLAVNRVADGP